MLGVYDTTFTLCISSSVEEQILGQKATTATTAWLKVIEM